MPSCPQSRLRPRSVHVNASERARGPSDYSLTTSEAPIDRALASSVHVNAWSFERGAPASSALAMLATLACWVMLGSRAPAGSVEPSTQDVEALHQARDFLKEFALDARESTETRRDAISALGRVHEALIDWGEAGQLEWYLDMLAKGLPGEIQGALAATAQSVAKARQHHLGSVRHFWRDLERNRKLVDEVREARSHFHKTARALDRKGRFVPNIKPFTLTMPKMNLPDSLKPYPEEPKK